MGNIRIRLQSKKSIFLLVALFAAGIFTGVSLYWIGFWFLLFWLTGSMGWLLLTALKLELNLQVDPNLTERFSTAELRISLSNRSFLPLPPGELSVAGAAINKTSPGPGLAPLEGEETMAIGAAAPSKPSIFHFQLHCLHRGRHKIGPVKARFFFPFGGLAVEKRFSPCQELTVQPRLLPFRGTFSLNRATRDRRGKSRYAAPESLESGELKPFVPGDPPRRIHWKVSAKLGDYYIRHPQNNPQTELLICMELFHKLYPSSLEQDLALEKALSLAGHLLSRGFSVGFLAWDGRMRYLSPAPGKQQLRLTRRLFTELELGNGKSLAEHILESGFRQQNAAMVWVAPKISEEYSAMLLRLSHTGKFCSLFLTEEAEEAKEADHHRSSSSPMALRLSCSNGIVEIKEAGKR